MKLKFFAIPALAPDAAEAELNRFLASHRVSQVERHLLPDGPASFWAVCVTWVEAEAAGAAVSEFVGDALGLTLKPPCLLPVTAGLGFCGMRIYPGTLKLGPRRRRAWCERRRHWEGLWSRGLIDDPATATTTSASVLPERSPGVAGKPSRGTCPRRPFPGGANRKGAGAPVGLDPNARRRPALSGAGP